MSQSVGSIIHVPRVLIVFLVNSRVVIIPLDKHRIFGFLLMLLSTFSPT